MKKESKKVNAKYKIQKVSNRKCVYSTNVINPKVRPTMAMMMVMIIKLTT